MRNLLEQPITIEEVKNVLNKHWWEWNTTAPCGDCEGLILGRLIELCKDGTIKEEDFRLWK